MEAYGWNDDTAPLMQTSAVGGAEWSISLPSRFKPRERFPGPSEQEARRNS
jgi:hypothetical protein